LGIQELKSRCEGCITVLSYKLIDVLMNRWNICTLFVVMPVCKGELNSK